VISDKKGAPLVRLSRAAAQEQAMEYFLSHLKPGMVLTCQITHLESFGAFLDIGCGIIAMLPVERISVSRITHPKERFRVGQKILAVVRSIDPVQRRITMTHKELLGTWMENASLFRSGETVRGIVRSIKPYGAFVELTPNLSGLAENTDGLQTGDLVSVYIKSIHPENMKIKLQIITRLQPTEFPEPLSYQITDGRLQHWVYSSADTLKSPIQTDFTASGS
jgi:small subunit ribosomal protein S1